MKPMRWVRGLFALEIASVVVGANCALAQFHHGGPPGYPSVGSYGYAVSGGFSSYPAGYGVGMNPGSSSWAGSSNSYGNLGYGGFGTTPYNYDYGSYGVSPFSVYGYGVTNGVGTGFQSSTSSLRGSTPISPAPQTTVALQPVFDVISRAPGWYRSSRTRRVSARTQPRMPREQLLADDGTIRWPGATSDDPVVAAARRAAEGAVKDVVHQGKSSGHASVRQVVDAKAKLTAFAREALPKVKARSAADARGLESFVVELEKTLQTMADRY